MANDHIACRNNCGHNVQNQEHCPNCGIGKPAGLPEFYYADAKYNSLKSSAKAATAVWEILVIAATIALASTATGLWQLLISILGIITAVISCGIILLFMLVYKLLDKFDQKRVYKWQIAEWNKQIANTFQNNMTTLIPAKLRDMHTDRKKIAQSLARVERCLIGYQGFAQQALLDLLSKQKYNLDVMEDGLRIKIWIITFEKQYNKLPPLTNTNDLTYEECDKRLNTLEKINIEIKETLQEWKKNEHLMLTPKGKEWVNQINWRKEVKLIKVYENLNNWLIYKQALLAIKDTQQTIKDADLPPSPGSDNPPTNSNNPPSNFLSTDMPDQFLHDIDKEVSSTIEKLEQDNNRLTLNIENMIQIDTNENVFPSLEKLEEKNINLMLNLDSNTQLSVNNEEPYNQRNKNKGRQNPPDLTN